MKKIQRSKYNVSKTTKEQTGYDSTKEAKRAKELEILEKAGEISNLEKQKEFVLQDSFVHYWSRSWQEKKKKKAIEQPTTKAKMKKKGKTERAIKFIVDFVYCEKGSDHLVCEDVKGMRTDAYKIKRKLFMKKFPEHEFREF